MTLTGTLGARLFIIDTPLPASYLNFEDAGNFASWYHSNTRAEIGLVENLNEMGRVYNTVSFESYQTGKTVVLKSGYSEGGVQFIFGQDLTDAGQALIRLAYDDSVNRESYLFKIILPGYGLYFGAQILAFKTQFGNVNNIIRSLLELSFSTKLCIEEITEYASEGGPYMYIVPTSGSTVTVPIDTVAVIMDPAATLATLGVTMPPSPGDGDVIEINTTKTIAALTVTALNGASVLGGVQMLSANGGMGWRYRAPNTTWYRRF